MKKECLVLFFWVLIFSGNFSFAGKNRDQLKRTLDEACEITKEKKRYKAISFSSHIESRPEQIRSLLESAEELLEKEQFDEAINLYQMMGREFNEPLAFYRLGDIYKEKANRCLDNIRTKCFYLKESCRFYQIALDFGFQEAKKKLIQVNKLLIESLGMFLGPPMSPDVLSMYN